MNSRDFEIINDCIIRFFEIPYSIDNSFANCDELIDIIDLRFEFFAPIIIEFISIMIDG